MTDPGQNGLNWLINNKLLMHNFFSFSIIFISFFNTYGQDNDGLISRVLMDDLTSYPVYKQLTDSINNEVRWKPEYAYLDDINIYSIAYLSDGLKVKGLLVKPKREGKYPCIIFNRGGNRDFGSLKLGHAAIWMGELAKEGYVTIASQYRGNVGSEGQEEFGGEEVNDVVNLISVLAELEESDTSKIGMYGWSRGGMMTFIALTKTEKIKAAVVGGTVSNMFDLVKDRPKIETNVLRKLIPNYLKNKEGELKKRSPIKWVDQLPKNVPILMLHGNADWRVRSEQSLKMALEMGKHKIPYRLIIFEGADHAISNHKVEVNEQVVSWFNRFLKDGESVPEMDLHGN